MDLSAFSPPRTTHRVPTHPIECLRVIDVPRCAFCGARSVYYCGGCQAGPAFCSADHFMKVCSESLYSRVRYLTYYHVHEQHWPIHSQTCDREVTGRYHTGVARTPAVHPYPGAVTLLTRSATDPLPPVSVDHMPGPMASGLPYDYVIKCLYAQHDSGTYRPQVWLVSIGSKHTDIFTVLTTDICRLIPINVSPTPSSTYDIMRLGQCFESSTVYRSFVIWYDRSLHILKSPLHVYYCERGYQGRYNPNRAMVRLTQTVDILLRRPWYGSVVVVKFGSRACNTYVDMSFDDLVHIRDYFAYFA